MELTDNLDLMDLMQPMVWMEIMVLRVMMLLAVVRLIVSFFIEYLTRNCFLYVIRPIFFEFEVGMLIGW